MNDRVNPAMISLAREARGLTQIDLAERLHITQGFLSKMESGHLGVPQETIYALSDILNFPPKFYFQKYDVYPASMHLYRKHKTLPVKDLNRITAWMNIYRFHVLHLLQAADIESELLPECDVDEFGSAIEVARAVRAAMKLPRGPIENLCSVLEDWGVVVIPFHPLNRKFQGASMLMERGGYIMLINADMPGDRFRWTLAHELGHIVMHRIPAADAEKEADQFAGEFLMPAREIGQYLSEPTLERLASLKRYWKTSISSILIQAKNIGAITENQYRTQITRLAKEGITRTSEPRELAIPREEPTLIRELVEYHTKELGYSNEELSDLMALNIAELMSIYKPPFSGLRIVRKTG